MKPLYEWENTRSIFGFSCTTCTGSTYYRLVLFLSTSLPIKSLTLSNSTPYISTSRRANLKILFSIDSLASQLSNVLLIVSSRQFLVALRLKTSTDDHDGNELSGKTNTGRPKDIQQYAYVQKALFKRNKMIILDF